MNINPRITQIAIPGSTLVVGALGGYFFAKKKFLKIADEEIRSVKDVYVRMSKPGTPQEMAAALVGDVEEAREELADKVETLEYVQEATAERNILDEIAVQESLTHNIFDTEADLDEDDPDFAPVRSETEPYLISTDEFHETNQEWTKGDLTYFKGDNTLMDDREEIWPDHSIVGIDNLDRFGAPDSGSKNPNTIYVRNERIEMDMEITLDLRDYTEAIMTSGEDPGEEG